MKLAIDKTFNLLYHPSETISVKQKILAIVLGVSPLLIVLIYSVINKI